MIELVEQNIRNALKEAMVWTAEYDKLSESDKSKLRHKLYQHEGTPGRLMMQFVESYIDWFKKRSWYVDASGEKIYYCIVDGYVAHGPVEWVGKHATEFFTATREFRHGGVKS